MMLPTQSVPGGCLIGFFGLIAWAYAGLCAWAIMRAEGAEHLSDREAIIHHLRWHAGVAFVVGFVLLILAWRLVRRMPPYDSRDPREPRVKF